MQNPVFSAVNQKQSQWFMEPLEARRLLTYGPSMTVIGLDRAIADFPSITGSGETVVIVDTGVDYNNPSLQGSGGAGFGPGHKVVYGYDYVDNDPNPFDGNGHGTGVSGALAADPFNLDGFQYQGVAPGVNIIMLRTDDGTNRRSINEGRVQQALDWVIGSINGGNPYNIVGINISNGWSRYLDPVADPVYGNELATLAGDGIFIGTVSGNSGGNNPVGIELPGADPNAYATGSTNVSGQISGFTQRGPLLDLLAPGENITVPYYSPTDSSLHYVDYATGTSFASPQVVGAAALLKQVDPTLTPAGILAILQSSGSDVADAATGTTYKELNVDAAIGMDYSQAHGGINNHAQASAQVLTFTGSTAPFTAEVDNQRLLIAEADYYKFSISQLSAMDITLTTTASSTPGMQLLNSSGLAIATLDGNDSIVLSAGTYYVKLSAPRSTIAGTYTLRIDQTPDDGAGNHTPTSAEAIALNDDGNGHLVGSVANNTLFGGTPDYYSFTLNGTADVNININYGGSDFPAGQLLASDGTPIDSFGSGGESTQLQSGQYLVKLSSDTTLQQTYGLTISASPVTTVATTFNPTASANSIAYTVGGTLDMAYYDTGTTHLMFVTRAPGGAWGTPQVVDSHPDTGLYTSMVIDPNGLPNIAYFDGFNGDLKFAHYTGSTWQIVTLDSAGSVGLYPSLAYNGTTPSIAYYARSSGDLRFVTLGRRGWAISTIASTGDVGRYPSLALNPVNKLFSVGYENTGTGFLNYAAQNGTGWSISVADDTLRLGSAWVSLAFTSSGTPAMSYDDTYNSALKYTILSGRTWLPEGVAGRRQPGLYTHLRFLPRSTTPQIIYNNPTNNDVVSAQLSRSGWSNTPIATGGGAWLSTAFNGSVLTFALQQGSVLNVSDM